MIPQVVIITHKPKTHLSESPPPFQGGGPFSQNEKNALNNFLRTSVGKADNKVGFSPTSAISSLEVSVQQKEENDNTLTRAQQKNWAGA